MDSIKPIGAIGRIGHVGRISPRGYLIKLQEPFIDPAAIG